MKKNISIEKKIDFSSMIGEISAISLEHNLEFISNDEISGELIISGRYKSTVASQIEEEFNERVPVSISLLEKVDISTARVEISDFYYDILDNSLLKCNIDLLIDALELVDDDRGGCPLDEDRECDGDPIYEKEIEIPKIEKTVEEEILNLDNDDTIERTDDNINYNNIVDDNLDVVDEDVCDNEEAENLFFNFDSSKETYGTFIVYIVRQNETINSILEKYNTSLEEIEKYNDIKNISIGSKLIIPLLNEKD